MTNTPHDARRSFLSASIRFAALSVTLLAGCGVSHSLHHVGTLDVHSFTLSQTSVHVVQDADHGLVMIDSGYERNAEALDHAMRAAGLDPTKIRLIVLTHAHADHAGAARYFQQQYGARVVAGRGDLGMLTSGHHEHMCPTGFLGRFRLSTDQNATYAPMHPDVLVDAPQSIPFPGGPELQVVPLPGHTNGSLVVVLGGAAFVGDLFRGSIVGSGAETHLYMCDLADNRVDIYRLLHDIAPGVQVFFTGHFGPVDRREVVSQFGP